MNIIRGIKDGIVRFASTLWDAAKDAAKGALDNVKNFLGIHSPSRVFRDQVGVMIGRGMAEGIEDSQRFVNRSMDRMARGMTLDGRLPDLTRSGATGLVSPVAKIQEGRQVEYAPTYRITQQDPDVVIAAINARDRRAMAGFGGVL